MTRTFALCHGAGLDYCASCQRWTENEPEASKDEKQAWIPEATSGHCAYYMQTHRAELQRATK